jgi:hypothetical protein
MHASGHGHQLFVDGRWHLVSRISSLTTKKSLYNFDANNVTKIISAIRQRKRSILSDPEWKLLPWINRQKTSKDALYDILVDVPTVLENADLMRDCLDLDLQEALRAQTIQDCWGINDRLVEWELTRAPHEQVAKLERRMEPIRSVLDLAAIHVMTLYWSTWLLLNGTMHEVAGGRPHHKLPEVTKSLRFCRNIANAMKWFFSEGAGMYGMMLATFPLGVAIQAVAVMPEKETGEVRSQLATFMCYSRGGVNVGKFLRSLKKERPQTRESQWEALESGKIKPQEWVQETRN